MRRFFIAIASLLLSFLTRLERLGDGLPSLTIAIPEGFLPSGFFGGADIVPAGADIAGVEDPLLDPPELPDPPLDPLLDPLLGLVSVSPELLLIGGVGELTSVFLGAVVVFLPLPLPALLTAEPDPELLAEEDEELPTLLIVTLFTLRVPVLAAIRIRRVFSSAADITLLEYYI